MALPGCESLPPALPVRSRYGVELRNAPFCEAELRTRRRNKRLIPNWNWYHTKPQRLLSDCYGFEVISAVRNTLSVCNPLEKKASGSLYRWERACEIIRAGEQIF